MRKFLMLSVAIAFLAATSTANAQDDDFGKAAKNLENRLRKEFDAKLKEATDKARKDAAKDAEAKAKDAADKASKDFDKKVKDAADKARTDALKDAEKRAKELADQAEKNATAAAKKMVDGLRTEVNLQLETERAARKAGDDFLLKEIVGLKNGQEDVVKRLGAAEKTIKSEQDARKKFEKKVTEELETFGKQLGGVKTTVDKLLTDFQEHCKKASVTVTQTAPAVNVTVNVPPAENPVRYVAYPVYRTVYAYYPSGVYYALPSYYYNYWYSYYYQYNYSSWYPYASYAPYGFPSYAYRWPLYGRRWL